MATVICPLNIHFVPPWALEYEFKLFHHGQRKHAKLTFTNISERLKLSDKIYGPIIRQVNIQIKVDKTYFLKYCEKIIALCKDGEQIVILER